MGTTVGCECVSSRDRPATASLDEELEKKTIERLRQQVAELQRRNAALEARADRASASATRVPSQGASGSGPHLAAVGVGRPGGPIVSNEHGLETPGGGGSGGSRVLCRTTSHHSAAGSVVQAAEQESNASNAARRPSVTAASGASPLSPQERSRLLAEAAEEARRSVPLSVAILFPNQSPGLLGMLAEAHSIPRAYELLRRANAVLEYDLEQMCADGPAATLDATKHCQPAVYVAGVAAVEKLRLERPEVLERCQAVAGIGVGEYAALHVAGVFDFELGLRLVCLRAEEMQRTALALKDRGLDQLSITGVELERVRALCEEARRSCERGGADEVCSVAYSVAPKAHICAGTRAATSKLLQLGKSQSNVDVRANLLETQQCPGCAAFQTCLMEPAQQHLRAALWEVVPKMRPPRCAVYFNALGEALPAGAEPTLVAEMLAAQLTTTVLWEQTVRTMLREGIEELFVCGPSTSGQLRDVIPKISADAGRRTVYYGI